MLGISPKRKETDKYIMAKELKHMTKRAENYSQWYNDLVVKAELAEQSAVRGCMVIKPYGYAIWEKMQAQLDKMFKETGVQNAYFPLLIPKSFLSREAEHVKGFAKECAVVTHYRLKASEDGNAVEVDPNAKLEEELIIRPTSETIIWNTYKNWIHSWRDLPLMCNQWCNVVQGVKSETERFAGALDTYTIEAMMQDGKALQSGTSHFLGQNFAKSFDVTFLNKDNKPEYVWATSWGVSTRLIGALIMTHSDDNGLVLPPKIAPIQVAIIPIFKGEEQLKEITAKLQPVIDQLRALGITVKYDDADNKRPGFKFADYELKGVPVRLAMGGRDLENNTIEVMRRDTLEKDSVSFDGIVDYVKNLLDDIQNNIFKKAKDFRDAHIYECENYEEFKEKVKDGGFFLCHWDGTEETEAKIKEDTQATIRCVPFMFEQTPGTDMVSGKPAKYRVIIARSY